MKGDTYTLLNHTSECYAQNHVFCECPYSVTQHNPRDASPGDIAAFMTSHGGTKEGKHMPLTEAFSKFIAHRMRSQPKGVKMEVFFHQSSDWKATDKRLARAYATHQSPMKIAALARKRAKRKSIAENPSRRCTKCFQYVTMCKCL